MLALHKEIHFEAEICHHLGQHEWLYEDGAASDFDTVRGLYLPDVLAWIEHAQPEAFERLTKTHGAQLGTVLADRVRKSLNERGTLEVLRRGVEMLGLKEPLQLAQFRPAGYGYDNALALGSTKCHRSCCRERGLSRRLRR